MLLTNSIAAAIPKLLYIGSNPSKDLRQRILLKKATWIEMDFTAAVYTWRDVFKYPAILIRPMGFVLFLSVILLNVAPPPSFYGRLSCYFYNILLGGAVYTWFINYKSPKHSIPLFFTLLLVTIVSSNDDTTIPNTNGKKPNSNSPLSDLLNRSLLPLFVGFLGGHAFIKLGKMESEMKNK